MAKMIFTVALYYFTIGAVGMSIIRGAQHQPLSASDVYGWVIKIPYEIAWNTADRIDAQALYHQQMIYERPARYEPCRQPYVQCR